MNDREWNSFELGPDEGGWESADYNVVVYG